MYTHYHIGFTPTKIEYGITRYVTETRQVELPLGTSINIDEITLDIERGTILGTARRADLSNQTSQ